MLRSELHELHYLVHTDNLASIRKHGILCFEAARQLKHNSVAMAEVQDKRDKVTVPNGKPLHQYANLYFHARNPMMFVRKHMHEKIVVLRVSTDVLDIQGTVIADANASSKWTGFWPSPVGLLKVNKDLTFAEDWTDQDQIQYWRKKSAKCAEVLVPKSVDVKYIEGMYVSCKDAKQAVLDLGLNWPVTVNCHLFFQ